MADATSSSGIDWSNIATTVFGQEVDKECGKIDFSGSKEKLTDGSAHMRAQAMADYACAYFKAIKENARTNLIIALIQQAASFYFADKQHDVAKRQQRQAKSILMKGGANL